MQAFNLDDFQWLEYYPGQVSRFPEVTVNTDSVTFNSASMRKLGSPTSIKILFDPKAKRIALQGFSKKGNGTIDFPPDRKSRDFGIHTLDKVRFVRGLMPEWDENTRFKVKGTYHEEANIMVYDLKDATIFKGGTYPGSKAKK